VLDAITCQALQLQPQGAPRRVLTPAGLAMALRSVQRPSYSPFHQAEPAGAWHARTPRGRAGIRHRTTLLHPVA